MKKRNGTFEARESRRTEEGPRSRTLASFTVLTRSIVDRIATRAETEVDPDELFDRARRAGAPVVETPIDDLAARLLRELSLGYRPRQALAHLLSDALPRQGHPPSHEADRMKMWSGASDAERGRALVDLLDLGDALPAKPRSTKSNFPRLDSIR